jgi:hypothetical protein
VNDVILSRKVAELRVRQKASSLLADQQLYDSDL